VQKGQIAKKLRQQYGFFKNLNKIKGRYLLT